jgi:MFS family permease
MLGTLGAALVSPWLAVAGRDWIGAEFTGSYLALAVIYLLNFAVLTAYREAPGTGAPSSGRSRPLGAIARQREFVVAASAAAFAYGIMALLMTATPISMHTHDGHSVEETAFVLQSHVIGMYAPSFVTGMLVSRFGVGAMIVTGICANAACALLGLAGREVLHYWAALTLLGFGWNLLFVAATTLLARSYQPAERFRVQTVNDFLMFGVMAGGALGAGPLLAVLGWRGLNEIALALLALLALTLARAGRGALRAGAG